jgi:hypothetical protein
MLKIFLIPAVLLLNIVLAKLLVRTLLQSPLAMIRLRINLQALWLSESGDFLQGSDGDAASATAGTKRVGKLPRLVKWTVELSDHSLGKYAHDSALSSSMGPQLPLGRLSPSRQLFPPPFR